MVNPLRSIILVIATLTACAAFGADKGPSKKKDAPPPPPAPVEDWKGPQRDFRLVDGNFTTTHLGDGELDVRWVMDALNSKGYTGDFALEYEVWDIEPVETGLVKWYNYAEGL